MTKENNIVIWLKENGWVEYIVTIVIGLVKKKKNLDHDISDKLHL